MRFFLPCMLAVGTFVCLLFGVNKWVLDESPCGENYVLKLRQPQGEENAILQKVLGTLGDNENEKKALKREQAVQSEHQQERKSWSANSPYWTCPPRYPNPVRRTPLIVFAEARSGSSFLMGLLDSLGESFGTKDLDIASMSEIYNGHEPQERRMRWQLNRTMDANCVARTDLTKKYWNERIAGKIENLQEDPQSMLGFTAAIPSSSDNAYFSFKSFGGHRRLYNFHADHLLEVCDTLSEKRPKVIVLWRRRVIERFVSEKVAQKTGSWGLSQSGAEMKVHVAKDELEKMIGEFHDGYKEVRAALDKASLDYLVLEYSKDLLNAEDHENTAEKVVRFLGLSTDGLDIKEALGRMKFNKQATVPTSEQVENWQEVVDWGYGGEPEEWDDVFA